MKTFVPVLILFTSLFFKTYAQTGIPQEPVFKPGKELSQSFLKKQPPPGLLELREEIINGTKKVNDLTLKELFFCASGKAPVTPRYNVQESHPGPIANGSQNGVNAAQLASAFHLTKDINTATSSSPANNNFNNYLDVHFAVMNNVSYFWADDGVHGNELWRSDGTPAGTYLVKDIVPGEGSGGGSEIVAVNNKIYFRGTGVADLWSSDGTTAGTQYVTTIPNTGGNSIFFFFAAGNSLYFVASTPGSIFNQLWKSDGTAVGTTLVFDAGTNNPGWGVTHLAYANGIVYFTNSDIIHGYELWRTNGTAAGTYVVRDIDPRNNNFFEEGPDYLTTYNNQLYFTQFDGSTRKLWVVNAAGNDATPAPGNNWVEFISSSYYLFANIPFLVSNNYLYFVGFSSLAGTELYKFDPVNGETLVKDINPGEASTNLPVYGLMADVNNVLYFGVQNSNNQLELWGTRGKPDNTQRVRLFNPGESFYNLFNAYGTLIFQAYSQSSGNELWKSDGTENGTVLVKDIYPGTLSGSPVLFTNCNNRVLFQAYGGPTGYELWASDGTEANTRQLKDINKTTTSGSYAGNYYAAIAPTAGGTIFLASQKEYGDELYRSDGTAAGTNLVKDILPGENGSSPRIILNKNGYTYFTAMGPDENNIVTTGIYRTDGTASGTVRIVSANTFDKLTVADNGLLYYIVYNPQNYTNELWRSNGLPVGTYMLASGINADVYPVAAGNTAYFVNGDGYTGYELWKSNGTVAGTKMIKDINPGVNSAYPYSLFAFNGSIFFGAFDGTATGIWRSNGTASGTIKLQDVSPVNSYNNIEINNYFCISNNTLFFVGSNALYGTELWKTTGTPASTKIVKDIFPGSLSSNPYYLRDVNGSLYLQAMDKSYAYGIWGSNGTGNGTRLIKNTGFVNYPAVAAGKYYFVLFDSLYVCDGTEAGTKAVSDDGLTGLHGFYNLTGSGNKLFFNAYTYQYGSELYVGDLTTGATTTTASDKSIKDISTFDAKIYPNPVKNAAQLMVSGDVKKLGVTVNDMNGKKVWKQTFNNTSQINLPAERLVSGIYFVTISNGTETKVIKLIKQ